MTHYMFIYNMNTYQPQDKNMLCIILSIYIAKKKTQRIISIKNRYDLSAGNCITSELLGPG